MNIKNKLLNKLHSNAASVYSHIRKNYIKNLPPTLIKDGDMKKLIGLAKADNYPEISKSEIIFVVENQKELETLFYHDKINRLLELLNMSLSLDGDVIELGTYKGGTTVLMARFLNKTNSKKTIYTYDTFEGFPYTESDTVDKVKISTGETKNKMDLFKDTSLGKVRSKFAKFAVADKIKIFKGSFDDTLPLLTDEKFSFALVDCDIYDSTLVCLREIYPRMVKGGIMLFDDYNTEKPWNLKKAVDDFVKEKNLTLYQGTMPYFRKP